MNRVAARSPFDCGIWNVITCFSLPVLIKPGILSLFTLRLALPIDELVLKSKVRFLPDLALTSPSRGSTPEILRLKNWE